MAVDDIVASYKTYCADSKSCNLCFDVLKKVLPTVDVIPRNATSKLEREQYCVSCIDQGCRSVYLRHEFYQ